MPKYTYITNGCQAGFLYKKMDRQYDNPFMFSLFLDDWQYVKLCKHFFYYINLVPIFGEPKKDNIWFKQTGNSRKREDNKNYPVMFLGDIEVHFIHAENKKEVLEKWTRRVERLKTNDLKPVFILTQRSLMNKHSDDDRKKLLTEFVSIENSFLLIKNNDIDNANARIIVYDDVSDPLYEDETTLLTIINSLEQNYTT